MANVNKNIVPAPKHHLRTLISSFFGFIALGLIISSILVVWLDRTLTNTDEYVKTIAPLVTKPEVQDFVVTKASSAILDNQDAPIADIAAMLLGPEQTVGKTTDQLRALITPIVETNIKSVVTSPAFATLWADSNRDIHSQLMTQLNSNAETISLNFHPLIAGVISQLGATQLSFMKEQLALKDDVGVITLQGTQLSAVHRGYDYFKKSVLAIIAAAVLSTILCILISVHHLKTARRIALLTGIYTAVLALLLSATSLVKVNGADAEQRRIALSFVDSLTHDLRLSLIVIAVVCIGGAIISKLYTVMRARKSPV